MAAKSEVANERWKFLRDALLKKKRYTNETTNQHSVRRFSTFELFDVKDILPVRPGMKWTMYSSSQLTVKVGLIAEDITLQDMMGFNNTGNVCIWPSEEIMAFYCLENLSLFKGKTVCELGAGMTGLAGLMLAATSVPHRVILTDGNEKSVDNLKTVIQSNRLSDDLIVASLLRWKPITSDTKCFKQIDVIICADCFFFTDVQSDLVLLMNCLLKKDGKAYLFAPERSGTFQLFVDKAREFFEVETLHSYHHLIDEKHLHYTKTNPSYDSDLHYPYCVILKHNI